MRGVLANTAGGHMYALQPSVIATQATPAVLSEWQQCAFNAIDSTFSAVGVPRCTSTLEGARNTTHRADACPFCYGMSEDATQQWQSNKNERHVPGHHTAALPNTLTMQLDSLVASSLLLTA